MKREEILGLLEGKEGSGVSIANTYTNNHFVQGVFVKTEETLMGTKKPDSIMLLYPLNNGRISIDTVYIDDIIRKASDRRLDIIDTDGEISISYDTPPLSGFLHEGQRDYDEIQKLAEEHGL